MKIIATKIPTGVNATFDAELGERRAEPAFLRDSEVSATPATAVRQREKEYRLMASNNLRPGAPLAELGIKVRFTPVGNLRRNDFQSASPLWCAPCSRC